jgi:hypothetical protein
MDASVSEATERERVERILSKLREGHRDPEYRRAVLVELFERGELAPANDWKN